MRESALNVVGRGLSDTKEPAIDNQRIVIMGAGHVGASAAYALMLRGLFREIVLIDSNPALAEAEAQDLRDANALARPAVIRAGDYHDAARAGMAVITAGAATHNDETRLSVAGRSADIVGGCVDALVAAGFDGILLIASNPVDLMAQVALRRSGFDPARVIGTGTLLDSNRLRQALAQRLGVAPAAVEALVLGEHGDSEVAAFSGVRIGGMPLSGFAPIDRDAVAKEVREAAYAILGGKGYTSWGVATAIVRICEAIVRGEHAVLPVSTLASGQFGIHGVYLSLPCVLGAGGVERVLEPALDAGEVAALQASAAVLRAAGEGLD